MNESNAFYKKHKNTILIVGLLLGGLFVIYQVIMPQFRQIQDNLVKLEEAERKVDTLKETVRVLATISDVELDQYYTLSNVGLPQGKDILLVFNELLAASQKTEITLGDLTINLGDVFARERKETDATTVPPVLGSPAINFTINVEGGVENIRAFAQELYNSIPVVEVLGISVNGERGEINANFFFNPLAQTSTDSEEAAKEFMPTELELINQLQQWSDASKFDSGQVRQAPSDEEEEDIAGTPSPSPSISPTVTISPN